jgi:hypothetical protein
LFEHGAQFGGGLADPAVGRAQAADGVIEIAQGGGAARAARTVPNTPTKAKLPTPISKVLGSLSLTPSMSWLRAKAPRVQTTMAV